MGNKKDLKEKMMKVNESGLDRAIRIVLGIVLLGLDITGIVAGGLGIAFIVLGALLLVTGIVGFCPAYGLLKFSTKKAS